jgi:hypothetical protein
LVSSTRNKGPSLDDIDHFTFGEQNPRVRAVVGDWLAKYFPTQY